MKKFYIPTLLAAFFLSSFYSQGQYISIASNPLNFTFDDPNFWITHIVPPNPCNACTIVIQSNVSMVQPGASTANPNNTIFTSQIPANTTTSSTIGAALTMGTKFVSNSNGYVTGIRFYKGGTMGPTHTGLLYEGPTQTLLGQVTFTNETASGWQTANFATPIAITAGVVYIIAYFVPDSEYLIDNGFFASSGVSNGHLTAFQDNFPTTGANGVFNIGPAAAFPATAPAPASGFAAVNQWVDVIFNTANLNDVVFNNSTIKVVGNTNININTYVELFNTSLTLGNDPTSTEYIKLNDQVDLNMVTSSVVLGNNLTTVDAIDVGASTIVGPHDDFFNPGTKSPGFFAIIPPDANGYDYTWTLDQGGLGSSTHQYTPSGNSHYILNCSATNVCADGLVFGPATTTLDATFGLIFIGSTTLPVELVQFLANKNDDGSVKVVWSTSQEQNSDFYDVERSSDQTGWASIGTVKAKGFSSTTSNYFLIDKSPLTGTGYYRLKMVDLDGKFKYSPTVAVTTDANSLPLVIYSNPFSDQIRLKINLSRPQNLTMTVSDMQGKTYITQSYQAQSGDNFVNIQPSVTSSGMYILRIQGDTYSQTVKLEKQ